MSRPSDSDLQNSSSVTPEEGAPPANPEDATLDEPEYIQLNSKELNNEIARLERENNDFARFLNSRIGNKAAKQYKPQIEAKEREIEALQMELRRRDILSMSEEDIESRFAADPEFAAEYAKLVHYKPEPKGEPDPGPEITEAILDAFEEARAAGIDEGALRAIQDKAARGEYDIEGESWGRSLQRMERDLARSLNNPKPKTNPEFSKGGPDLTPANRNGGSARLEVPDTIAGFKALPKARQMEILDDPEGMAAVEALAKKGT